MWKTCLFAVALVALPAQVGFADPARYVIDPEHVTVGFRVDHLGFARVIGFFRDVEGSYVFDEDSGAISNVDVRVGTDSVFSNHEERDEHVSGRDFLDSGRHPEMYFTVLSVERVAERRFDIIGQLQLLGVVRVLRLEATWNKSGTYPIGRDIYAMGVSASGVLKRSDYGMDYGVANGWVGDDVEIFVEFEARRQ